ncbi:carbohydrate-binding protein [Nocardioides humi]|uniref:carbohydrate-binding protein n=1 Tax=Nocardioides humi TaxID=449461 RepID=UPI003CCC79F1
MEAERLRRQVVDERRRTRRPDGRGERLRLAADRTGPAGRDARADPDRAPGTFADWSAVDVYKAGDRVQLRGRAYVAQWWNQGVSPEAPSTKESPSPWRPLTQEEIADGTTEDGSP